jgi:hypothetical protein
MCDFFKKIMNFLSLFERYVYKNLICIGYVPPLSLSHNPSPNHKVVGAVEEAS